MRAKVLAKRRRARLADALIAQHCLDAGALPDHPGPRLSLLRRSFQPAAAPLDRAFLSRSAPNLS
jgi:hypothetical protein